MLQQGVLREPSLIGGMCAVWPHSILCQAKQASLVLAAPCVRTVCSWCLPPRLDGLISSSALLAPRLWPSRFDPKPLRKGAPPPAPCLAGWPQQRVAASVNLPEQATSLDTPLINDPSSSELTAWAQRPAFSYLAQGADARGPSCVGWPLIVQPGGLIL